MTKYYIHKNAQAETITRKATPEEIKMYEEQLNKTRILRSLFYDYT